MSILLTSILFFLPGYLLSHFISQSHKYILRNTLLISTTLIPLVFLYNNFFLSIPIDQTSILATLAIINIFSATIFKIYTRKKTRIDKERDNVSIVMALVSAVVFYYLFFIYHPISLSGDISHFLYDVAYIVKNHQLLQIFDRNFTLIFPAIFHKLSGIGVESSIKAYILVYYIILSQTTYFLSQKILKNKIISIITTATILFSEAFIKNIVFIMPFTIAIVILYSIIEILTNSPKNIKNYSILFVYYLWATIFNIHGVVAFGSLIIVPTALLTLFKESIYSNKKIHLIGFALFLLSSQPLLSQHSSKLVIGVINPIVSKITNSQNISNPNISAQKNRELVWVSKYTGYKKTSITQFPVFRRDFIQIYSLPVMILSLYGLWVFFQKKKDIHKPLIATIIFTFIYTQQRLLGVDWFSFRFVYVLSIPIFILSTYGLKTFIKRIKKLKLSLPKHALPIIIIILGITPTKNSIDFLRKVPPVISQEEYSLYTSLENIVKKDTVFIVSPYSKWAFGLSPQANIFRATLDKMCQIPNEKQSSVEEWIVNQSFSTNSSLDESIKALDEYTNNQNYYVILNTNAVNCINSDLFPVSHYDYLVDGDNTGIYLLKSK